MWWTTVITTRARISCYAHPYPGAGRPLALSKPPIKHVDKVQVQLARCTLTAKRLTVISFTRPSLSRYYVTVSNPCTTTQRGGKRWDNFSATSDFCEFGDILRSIILPFVGLNWYADLRTQSIATYRPTGSSAFLTVRVTRKLAGLASSIVQSLWSEETPESPTEFFAVHVSNFQSQDLKSRYCNRLQLYACLSDALQ